jgi:hypothetical protein
MWAERNKNNHGSSHQPQACSIILKEIISLNIFSLNYGLKFFIVEDTWSRRVASGSSLFLKVSNGPFLLNLPEE